MAAQDQRVELRLPADFGVQIWGTDANGINFAQAATAANISSRGALLLGIQRKLRSGDLIRIQYGEASAKFRVVWASPCPVAAGNKVAVQRIETEPCIWGDGLAERREPRPKPARPLVAAVAHL